MVIFFILAILFYFILKINLFKGRKGCLVKYEVNIILIQGVKTKITSRTEPATQYKRIIFYQKL